MFFLFQMFTDTSWTPLGHVFFFCKFQVSQSSHPDFAGSLVVVASTVAPSLENAQFWKPVALFWVNLRAQLIGSQSLTLRQRSAGFPMYSADASVVGEPMTKVFGFTVLLNQKVEKKR